MAAAATRKVVAIYEATLRKARTLQQQINVTKEQQDELRVELMLLLVELRAQDLLWRPYHESWADLLRMEKLCSVNLFKQFERGVRLTSIEEAEKYGVTALKTIAQAPTAYRSRLIKNLRAWHSSQAEPPTYRAVSRWVWRRCRELDPERFASRAKLMRYIDDLKGQLKKHGVRPKSPPRGV